MKIDVENSVFSFYVFLSLFIRFSFFCCLLFQFAHFNVYVSVYECGLFAISFHLYYVIVYYFFSRLSHHQHRIAAFCGIIMSSLRIFTYIFNGLISHSISHSVSFDFFFLHFHIVSVYLGCVVRIRVIQHVFSIIQ